MARRIFRIIIAVSIVLEIYLYTIREAHSKSFMVISASIVFLLLSMGIHGLIAHSFRPESKGELITYPILMWVLWAVLFLLFVFFVVPIYCPDFLIDL